MLSLCFILFQIISVLVVAVGALSLSHFRFFSSLELKDQVNISVSIFLLYVVLVIFFSRTTVPISTKLNTKHPWVMVIQVCSNEGPRIFPRGNNYEIAKYIDEILKKIFYSRITGPISITLGTKHPWVKVT